MVVLFDWRKSNGYVSPKVKQYRDKAIWKCGDEYRSHQGRYPVVFLTFKDVKFDTWEATIDKIKGLLQEESANING